MGKRASKHFPDPPRVEKGILETGTHIAIVSWGPGVSTIYRGKSPEEVSQKAQDNIRTELERFGKKEAAKVARVMGAVKKKFEAA